MRLGLHWVALTGAMGASACPHEPTVDTEARKLWSLDA